MVANLLSDIERQEEPASFLERLVLELRRFRLKEKEKVLAGKVGRMLNGAEPKNQETINQYRDLTRLLKGFDRGSDDKK